MDKPQESTVFSSENIAKLFRPDHWLPNLHLDCPIPFDFYNVDSYLFEFELGPVSEPLEISQLFPLDFTQKKLNSSPSGGIASSSNILSSQQVSFRRALGEQIKRGLSEALMHTIVTDKSTPLCDRKTVSNNEQVSGSTRILICDDLSMQLIRSFQFQESIALYRYPNYLTAILSLTRLYQIVRCSKAIKKQLDKKQHVSQLLHRSHRDLFHLINNSLVYVLVNPLTLTNESEDSSYLSVFLEEIAQTAKYIYYIQFNTFATRQKHSHSLFIEKKKQIGALQLIAKYELLGYPDLINDNVILLNNKPMMAHMITKISGSSNISLDFMSSLADRLAYIMIYICSQINSPLEKIRISFWPSYHSLNDILARLVHEILRTYVSKNVSNESPTPNGGQQLFSDPILVVLDRSFDMRAPIRHSWYYGAFSEHELVCLDSQSNRISNLVAASWNQQDIGIERDLFVKPLSEVLDTIIKISRKLKFSANLATKKTHRSNSSASKTPKIGQQINVDKLATPAKLMANNLRRHFDNICEMYKKIESGYLNLIDIETSLCEMFELLTLQARTLTSRQTKNDTINYSKIDGTLLENLERIIITVDDLAELSGEKVSTLDIGRLLALLNTLLMAVSMRYPNWHKQIPSSNNKLLRAMKARKNCTLLKEMIKPKIKQQKKFTEQHLMKDLQATLNYLRVCETIGTNQYYGSLQDIARAYLPFNRKEDCTTAFFELPPVSNSKITQGGSQKKDEKNAKITQYPKVVVLFILGGLSHHEIADIRKLQQELDSRQSSFAIDKRQQVVLVSDGLVSPFSIGL